MLYEGKELKCRVKIREAYEFLRDTSKRSLYDIYYPQLREQWIQYRTWQEARRRQEEQRREAEAAHRLAEAERIAKEYAEQKAKEAEERRARERAEEERLSHEREARERVAEERSREAARKARENQEQAARARLRRLKELEAERKSEEAVKRARREQEMAAEERLKFVLMEEKQDAVRQNWAGMREAAERRQAKPMSQCHAADCIHPRLGWPRKKGRANCIFCNETLPRFSFRCPECQGAACPRCKTKYCIY